jgi:hypothetical protein
MVKLVHVISHRDIGQTQIYLFPKYYVLYGTMEYFLCGMMNLRAIGGTLVEECD